MKFKDVNNEYTKKVSKYMAEGMTINTSTMGGSQGEIASIDLTDGQKIYRIMLERFKEDDDRWLEGVKLVVGISTDDIIPNCLRHDIIWNSGLEIVEEQRFYQISERCHERTYYGTREEAKAAQAIRHERWQNQGCRYGASSEDITSKKTVAIAVPRIKREFGIKNVVKKDVKVFKQTCLGQNDGYTIQYHSKKIRIA